MKGRPGREPVYSATVYAERKRSAWPWVFLAIALTVILVAGSLTAFVFWRIETWPTRTAAGISQVFRNTLQFQPKVTVNEQVVLEQATRTAELATAQRRLVVERGYENRWLLSTKRLRARGTFTAKAGFDLTKEVTVKVDKRAGTIVVVFPAPRLLSLGDDTIDFLQWDNGWWNRLKGTDAQQAVNELCRTAERRANEEGLLTEARRSVTDQLTARLGDATQLKVVVTFAGAAAIS
jgi:Protein of unknown function (DUF4230)